MFAGVDIGGTKTAVVLSAEPPDIVWRAEFPTRPEDGWQHAMEKSTELLRQAARETKASLRAIGVSCGGPLNRIAGIVQRPPNLPTWDAVPVKSIFEAEFGIPCYLENDANAGAVAEHRFGAGRGCRHMAFLTMGTGLGAGLILNGSLFRGANDMAGEIGHVRLTPSGPQGYDKEGSVEGWASGGGMVQQAVETIREAIARGEPTLLASSLYGLTARDIGVALAAGDKVAARIVEETGERLGEALAILVDILNPERIVVGGLALRLGEHLLMPARRSMRTEALPAAVSLCTVVPAELGEKIGDVAAICVAMGLTLA